MKPASAFSNRSALYKRGHVKRRVLRLVTQVRTYRAGTPRQAATLQTVRALRRVQVLRAIIHSV